MIDFLRPIHGDNRDEILFIGYEGFLKNTAEELILKMKLEESEMLELYGDRLKTYFSMSHLDLYNSTVFFSPEELLYILSNGELSMEQCKIKCLEYLERFKRYSVEDIRMETIYSFALTQLFNAPFVKSVLIYYKNTLSREELDTVLFKIVRGNQNKLRLFHYEDDSDLNVIVKENEPTTLFLNSYDIMESIIQNMSDSYKNKALFFIRGNTRTATYNTNTKTIIPIHNTEYYLKRGINMVFTTIPSTEIDKSLSDEEPMG